MKKIFKLITVNVIIFVLFLLFLEGGSRLFFPKKEVQAIFNDQDLRVRGRPFVEHHPVRGFALKSGFKNNMYTVNSEGFRGEEFPDNMKKHYIVLALGESTTFGWRVHDRETYPWYLMKDLNRTFPKAYVVNAGIPSYTSSQVRLYLDEILNKNLLHPDLILVNIMWNDIWYSTVGNWHKDILVYQKPPVWYIWLNKNSRLFTLMTEVLETKEKKVDRYNAAALDYYGKNLEQMAKRCKQENISLVFVEPPFDADHMPKSGLNEFHIRYTKAFFIKTAEAYRKMMHEVAKKYNITVLAHRLDMQELHQKDLFLDALHPKAEGNKMMADDLSKKMVDSLKVELIQ